MSDLTGKSQGPSATDRAPADLTGQDRMVRNVVASWAGHLVFIAAGFVLPRVVDNHLGQVSLGVWDFGWSVVGYLGLLQAGIGTSVNRYVAKYRSAGDHESLRCATASVHCVLVVAASLILVLSLVAGYLVPALLSDRLAGMVSEARWVVMLLGVALAIQVAFVAFNGAITGCHRWDLHNGINAGFYAASVTAMIVTLVLGGGLRGLALCYTGGVALAELTRAAVAYRVCPELCVRFKYARWSTACRMMAFGGKTFLPRVSDLLRGQTTSILIAAYLGPAALAVYSRPRSLVQQVGTLVAKFAFVLTPTTSSLQAQNDQERIRSLLINTTRYAAFIALPLILVLTVFGDFVLRVWMGSDYARGTLLAVLALGFFATTTHQTVFSILSGLNMHGRPGIAKLGGAIVTVGLAVAALGPLNLGLVGAALAVTLPLIVVDGFYLPFCACGRIGIPLRTFLVQSYRGPLACTAPFLLCLLLGRLLFAQQPVLAFGWGMGVGVPLLAITYWKHALPQRVHAGVRRYVDGVVQRVVGARL